MAFSYPEFSGGLGEEVLVFLEQMVVACITNHIVEPASMLRLLQICIKGDARLWLPNFEAQQQAVEPPVLVTVDLVKDDFKLKYQRVEEPDKVWHAIQNLKQGEMEPIEASVKRFTKLWEQLCIALLPEQPPAMIKKDSSVAGLKATLRWRVELKNPTTFDEAMEMAKNKEWKVQHMTQLGMGARETQAEPRRMEVAPIAAKGVVPIVEPYAVVPVVPVAPLADEEKDLKKEGKQMMELMKNLSLNLVENGSGRGRGRGAAGGRGFYGGRRTPPTCFNCGELGHYSTECDKPYRAGGDMFPLPSRVPDRSRDYGVEIKGDAGPSGLKAEEKGKTKVVNVITLEKSKKEEEADAMLVGKRTTAEREPNRGVAGPSKKKGKMKEGDDITTKKKRAPRRKFHVSDFPLGDGQSSYSLKDDLASRKADITFVQLVEMIPRMKRQWKQLVNPKEKEPRRGSVRVMSVAELPDICPIVEAWHKGRGIGQAYIDGGAQICVITHACVEQLGLTISGHPGFKIRMANHQKVKCLGVVQDLEVEVFHVKALVTCHVMPAGLGAFPLILGRPWLRVVGAVQDWKKGIITLQNKKGNNKKYDMGSRKLIKDDEDEEERDEDEDDATTDSSSEESSDSESTSDSDAEVAFLVADEDSDEEELTIQAIEEEEEQGPYEEIEELMKPKVEPHPKQEIIKKMLSQDLTSKELVKYEGLLAKFPGLFITSYEEIKGFQGEDLRIELKEGAQPVRQKLRRMGT